jgi:hypothetical protein
LNTVVEKTDEKNTGTELCAYYARLQETGYIGYLGQEFLLLGDPIEALKQAFDLCNIAL